MKKYLILIPLVLALSSCLTVGRIERNRDEILSVLGTQNSSTIYKDTTIYLKDTVRIQLPADTASISHYLSLKNGKISLDTVTVKKGLITARAWVNDSKLGVDAFLNKASIQTVHRDTITITKIVKETNTVVEVKPEKYIPKFYLYSGWIVIALLSLGGVFVGLKVTVGSWSGKIKGLFNLVKSLF